MAKPKKVSELASAFAIRQVYRSLLRSIPPSVRFSRPAASNLRRLIRDDFSPSIDEQGTVDPVISKQELHLKGETRREGKQGARELLIVLRLRRSFHSRPSFWYLSLLSIVLYEIPNSSKHDSIASIFFLLSKAQILFFFFDDDVSVLFKINFQTSTTLSQANIKSILFDLSSSLTKHSNATHE